MENKTTELPKDIFLSTIYDMDENFLTMLNLLNPKQGVRQFSGRKQIPSNVFYSTLYFILIHLKSNT